MLPYRVVSWAYRQTLYQGPVLKKHYGPAMHSKFHGKLVSFISLVTTTLAFPNALAYHDIFTLRIHNVFIVKAPVVNLI
jgi:hypothetical protein